MKTGKFIKQAAVLAIASLLVRLLGFLYRLPLTDMLGDEGNGIYSAGFYLYNFFLVLSSAGLPSAISKIVSEKIALGEYKNAKKVFKISLIMASLAGGFFSILMFVSARAFCDIIGSPDSYYAIVALSPTVFIVSIMSVFRGYFQGNYTTIPTAISQVVEQIFNAIFSIYLAYVLVKMSLPLGAAGGTAGTGIGAFAGLMCILAIFIIKRKEINKNLSIDTHKYNIEKNGQIIKNVLKTAVPIIAGTAIFSITNLIDMQMVTSRLGASGAFSDSEIMSLYGQLTGKYVTLTTLPISISTALATAVLPSIASNIVQKKYKIVREKIGISLKLVMIITIPAAVGIGVLAREILLLLFPNHSDGEILIRWGAISIVFLSLYQILTGILQGINRMRIPAQNALIGSIIKIPINYFLIVIPSINVLGAVISTTICYIVASALNLKAVKICLKVKINYKDTIIKPLLSAIIMGICCKMTYNILYYITEINSLSVIVSIILAIIIYLIILCIIGGIQKTEIYMLPMGEKIYTILKKLKLIK